MPELRLPDVPGLTGLRFFAAMSIVCNHLLLRHVPRTDPIFATMLSQCGLLGMNLFFVLSGFIIHYNYSSRLSDFRASSFYAFVCARIARLYPLFIFAFVLEIVTGDFVLSGGLWRVIKSLPFYLTMTQTWGYVRPDGALLPYMYQRSNLTWSISTEMLLYCFYPAILAVLLRDRLSHWWRVGVIVVVTLASSLFLRWLINVPSISDNIGIAWFGQGASLAANPNTSFWFWLNSLSPYTRFFEFLIGAMAAHLFFRMRDSEPGPREQLLAAIAAAVALGFILGTFLPPSVTTAFTQVQKVIGYYPFVGVIVFCLARYPRMWLTTLLSGRTVVQFGEWSYSIYLFHIYVIYAVSEVTFHYSSATIRVVVLFVTVICCARILYTYIEMPARTAMRDWLQRSGQRVMRPAAAGPDPGGP